MAMRRPAPIDRDLADLPPEVRRAEWRQRIDVLMFAASGPISALDLAAVVSDECVVADLVAEINEALRGRPYEIVSVAGGYQYRTRPRFADVIAATRPQRSYPDLTERDLVVLATIAYMQPITRAQLCEATGQDVTRDRIGRLRALDLVDTKLRGRAPGAPAAYVTTPRFLERFGLESVSDLPDVEVMRSRMLLETGDLDHPALTLVPESVLAEDG